MKNNIAAIISNSANLNITFSFINMGQAYLLAPRGGCAVVTLLSTLSHFCYYATWTRLFQPIQPFGSRQLLDFVLDVLWPLSPGVGVTSRSIILPVLEPGLEFLPPQLEREEHPFPSSTASSLSYIRSWHASWQILPSCQHPHTSL